MTYIQGESRSQTSLFPVSLEELIPEDHLDRLINLCVTKLDLVQLGLDDPSLFCLDIKTRYCLVQCSCHLRQLVTGCMGMLSPH